MDSPDKQERIFDENTRIVALQHFFSESEARLCAARLKEADIPSFISNANIMTALPLGGGGGISLHIRASDLEKAQGVMSLWQESQANIPEEDYREIDEEEIAYLKALKEQEIGSNQWNALLWIAIVFAILLIIRAFARAAGLMESWRDFF